MDRSSGFENKTLAEEGPLGKLQLRRASFPGMTTTHKFNQPEVDALLGQILNLSILIDP